MAQWLAHSNQKLYQARLLLETFEQIAEEEGGQVAPAALLSGMQESVIFQLILAYQSYLHELAETAQCREEFYSLAQLLEKSPVVTGEMTELHQLELDDFSWLSQMQSAFDQCGQKDTIAISKASTSLQMIQLQDTTASSLPLRNWYQTLTDIIDLQRNNRQES
ncbi:hypothetical protein A9R00_08755 [Oleispira antarctica]|uniref:Uncharacterized protein n=1 Tax=Oleispira antarctica TaxID=188908 RepID=A0A1Y5HVV1_OLEAN|nr:hypothetical protein A9R00_08755 [Oleispira antarctica]